MTMTMTTTAAATPGADSLPPIPVSSVVRARGGHASRRFFVVLIIVASVATVMLFLPLAPVLLFAAVLASAVAPLYERFVVLLRGRRRLAALLFAATFIAVILVPLIAASVSVARDIAGSARTLAETVNTDGVEGLIERLPSPVRAAIARTGIDAKEAQERISALSGKVVSATGSLLMATGLLMFSVVMLLIALVVFLVDGRTIAAWLTQHLPLEKRQTEELGVEFHKISVSLILGNFGTALAQALVALVGFLIAGVPTPLVFTLFTFLFSLVPTIGGAGVGLVAAAVVALKVGLGWQPIFLAAWSIIVVGLVDNIVKPILVKRGVELNGALVFFAILSGIAAFGATGLLLGPIIVSFALTLLKIYKRDFKGRLDPDIVAVPVQSPPPGTTATTKTVSTTTTAPATTPTP